MHTIATQGDAKQGSALVSTLILLGIAGITMGGMLATESVFMRNSERTHNFDSAFFLADTGLQAALVKLNAVGDPRITYDQSRAYFTSSNSFSATDWGFNTEYTMTNSSVVVVSTGRFKGQLVTAQASMSLGAGNRRVHALYAHALFAGNTGSDTNFNIEVGGTGSGADFVRGDTYSGGGIALSGTSKLRLPEMLNDSNTNEIADVDESWQDAFTSQRHSNALSQAAFDTYKASMSNSMNNVYNNGVRDPGEAYVDTIGNGLYDVGEPFTDTNGNGVRDARDSFIDRNGNGVYNAGVDTVVDHGNGQYDTGEEWVEDSVRKISNTKVRLNGRWDAAGGYWRNTSGSWSWRTTSATTSWPAESYEDVGDGVYDATLESYTDQNGVYDVGEQFVDDRNTVYDYGVQAVRSITGMPSPSTGQIANSGNDPKIDPPDLMHMYYEQAKAGSVPGDALDRWGHDVSVTAADYGSAKVITDSSKPEHIFVRNPGNTSSGSSSSGGKTVYNRTYTPLYDTSGNRIDDYFLEDPIDSTYNSPSTSGEIQGIDETAPMYLDVKSSGNDRLYFVDGNVYIHNPQGKAFRFKTAGTRITIVASGNIVISDEFYYNGTYASGLTYNTLNSRVISNPQDILCLIALKSTRAPTNSGNVFLGDQQFGTGGSIHAMLYAENDFVDNNLNTVDQQFISVFGNMTAGNKLKINRPAGAGAYRTRLDVSLDERIRLGSVVVPGLPHPVGSQRSIVLDTAWHMQKGSWTSWSMLQ